MKRLTDYLIVNKNMKTKTKSYNKEKKHQEKTSKCFEDVCEHDNVYAQLWKLPHEKNQACP